MAKFRFPGKALKLNTRKRVRFRGGHAANTPEELYTKRIRRGLDLFTQIFGDSDEVSSGPRLLRPYCPPSQVTVLAVNKFRINLAPGVAHSGSKGPCWPWEQGSRHGKENSITQTPFSKRVIEERQQKAFAFASTPGQANLVVNPFVILSQLLEINQVLQRHRQRWGCVVLKLQCWRMRRNCTPLTCFVNLEGVLWKIGLCRRRQM